MELLKRLEERREPSSAPSRTEEVQRRQLNDGIDELRQELGAAALQRKLQQLEELMAAVRMQDRKRQVGPFAPLSSVLTLGKRDLL
jgi:hypothetical protein